MRRPTLLHHELTVSSLGSVCQSCTTPLLLYRELQELNYEILSVSESLETGVDTHTHTLSQGLKFPQSTVT